GIRAELGETLLAVHRARGSLAQLAAELSRTRDPESALLAARAYEELGQDESALEAYRHASHARPRDLELAQRILRLLSRRGRIEDVIAEYRTLRQRVPEHTDYVVELCLLLSDTGRRDEALQLLAEAGRSHPRDLRLHQRMADLYARWRQDTALARELELLARLDPDEPTHVVALGEAQLAQGKPEAARATFRRILERAGDAAEAHAQLGQVYLEHDLVPDALVEYERALHDRPEDAAFVRGHAEVLERALRPADAAREWEHVLALAGDDAELRRDARKRLINLWAELGELPSRINELEHKLAAADGGKGDPDTARFLADAYERLAHNAMRGPDVQRVLLRAEDALQRVVRAVPGDVPSWLSIERLRVRRGDLEGAVAALDQLVQLDPRNARTYLARMADHALALYRDTDAIRYAERAVDLAPDDANAHERLGDLYRAQKDSERALASYERALALDPQRYALALRVAEMVLVRGDAERADALYLRALRESSDDDLVARAFRAALELRTTSGDLDALERELLGAALAHPDRPVYRRQLIDLYSGMVHRLELRSAGSGADAEAARAELRAI
ncbi:MAG TPA: tetratricopeptide repeat protein, partial [Polyangiales bacterium]|nr:tetratricopeptide repeat protein [Polyangiales bacterium]